MRRRFVPPAAGAYVWRFGEEPRSERFVDSLPVRLGSEGPGEIDLGPVFAEG
jgi:hypothetical protein